LPASTYIQVSKNNKTQNRRKIGHSSIQNITQGNKYLNSTLKEEILT